MDKTSRLKIALCWHMHQPDYRNYRSGQYQLPWTFLHAIKDYVDMAAHLENNPQARVTINFTPILLVQIDDYNTQIQRYFAEHASISDPLLNALIEPTLPATLESRLSLLKACMRVNETHLVNRFMPLQHLYRMGERLVQHPGDIAYLNNQYFADLIMWYHLAWLGESVRNTNVQVARLIDKEKGYTLHDRHELLAIIGELMASVISRYRSLSERNQIELSLSPYGHPIIPLLLDMNVARQSMPDVTMPLVAHYPGGYERSHWHLQQGIDIFEHYFSSKPRGCWLSEGGVSTEAIALLDQFKFAWTASGENVLRNSLHWQSEDEHNHKEHFLYQPYQLEGSGVCCFFRDDQLSDLIGFTYSDWHADDAAANLLHRLQSIARHPDTAPGAVVSLILDGENAWEYYPNNGYYFLNALYRAISESPELEFVTFSDCLPGQSLQYQQHSEQPQPLLSPRRLHTLRAGSWVYGSFSTWIGDAQKNRGWDMLADAKQCYDSVMASGQLNEPQRKQAEQQLAVCESSDWFWWFGDYNLAETVSDFERLFRMHLANLYEYLNQEPPDYLAEVFTHGSGHPVHGGVMRAGTRERD